MYRLNFIISYHSDLSFYYAAFQIKNAWARYEDVNLYDNAPVIGDHLLYKNYLIACGFGERGIQHSLAAARGISEKVYEGAFLSINLGKFDMRRFVSGRKIDEIY